MVSIKQSKFIKSLNIKKYRVKEKSFIAEGRKNVLEGIKSDYKLKHLLATVEFLRNNVEVTQFVGHKVIEVTNKELEGIGTFTTNNDCLAVFGMPDANPENIAFDDHIIAVDGLSDPGNLGTIIRTMDWFGFKHLVCSSDTTDVYNPKVINATMGSYCRVKVYYTDLSSFIQRAPIAAYGADFNGIPLSKWDHSPKSILVFGSESHGISVGVKSHLKSTVTIEKVGAAESLNVGIATGIICHHLRS
ncbi:MAG: RNA methyltransferase [Marinoscillum sp.]